SVSGIDQWEAKFVDNSMILSGSMSSADLRRIVSLFAFPRLEEEQEKVDPAAPVDAPNVPATKRYRVAGRTNPEDIKRGQDSPNYGKTATWHEKAAVQLEQLARKNVDPLAVDVAYQSARDLRAIAASLRGVPVDTGAIGEKAYAYTQVVPGYNYGWGPYW